MSLATPLPVTTTPICPHFGICGGCDLQDVAYTEQVAYKQSLLESQFSNFTGSDLWKPMLASSEPYPLYFRNKIRFAFIEHEGALWPSRHKRGDSNADIPVRECFLQSDYSMQIINWIADYATEHQWQLFKPSTSTGWLKHVLAREGKSTNEYLISIVTTDQPIPDGADFAEQIMKQFPSIVSLFQTRTKDRNNFDSQDYHLAGAEYFHEMIGSYRFRISPHAFFQTNSTLVSTLYDAVAATVSPQKPTTLWDLYAGSATIGIYLHSIAERVLSIESNPSNIQDAQWNLTENGVTNLKLFGGMIEEVCTSAFIREQGKPDCIVVDPPRAGLSEVSRSLIAGIRPKQLVYVSCNPATCRRDLIDLQKRGFQIVSLQGVDMFPHTLHCEMIAELSTQ